MGPWGGYLPGGYISFTDPQKDEIEQILFLGKKPELRNLGSAGGLSLRAFVDAKTSGLVQEKRKPNTALLERGEAHRAIVDKAARHHAESYAI